MNTRASMTIAAVFGEVAGLLPSAALASRGHANLVKLRTKSLEDYMPIKTVGEDNVLRVTVVVSSGSTA